jgi:putative addiction module component (TIGR02574 family)
MRFGLVRACQVEENAIDAIKPSDTEHVMNSTAKGLLESIRALSREQQAEIVAAILDQLEPDTSMEESDVVHDEELLNELERRAAEVNSDPDSHRATWEEIKSGWKKENG